MIHTHYFRSLSDASNFVDSHKNATHLGDGVVEIKCQSDDELEYWQGCEEYGPFPGDNNDLR